MTKNIVSITDKGRVLCQAIEGNLLASPSMTAKWEAYLRKIGNGEGTQEAFPRQYCEVHSRSLLEEVPRQLEAKPIDIKLAAENISINANPIQHVEVAPCPACKQGMIVARKEFYGCSDYKNGCKQTFPGVFLKKKLHLLK